MGYRQAYVLALALAALRTCMADIPCPSDGTVTVHSQTITLTSELTCVSNATFVITNSTIFFDPPCMVLGDCPNAGVSITTSKSIRLEKSSISAPSVVLEADVIALDAASKVTASALGPGTTPQSSLGTCAAGGGHGGFGGIPVAPASPPVGGCHDAHNVHPGAGYGSMRAPWHFGGPGAAPQTSRTACSRGGGRVRVKARVQLSLDGELSAVGQSPVASEHATGCGGAAGGSIVVSAAALASGAGAVLASGGFGVNGGGGGGGGRILLDMPLGAALTQVAASGGVGSTASDGTTSAAGGHGTVFQLRALSLAVAGSARTATLTSLFGGAGGGCVDADAGDGQLVDVSLSNAAVACGDVALGAGASAGLTPALRLGALSMATSQLTAAQVEIARELQLRTGSSLVGVVPAGSTGGGSQLNITAGSAAITGTNALSAATVQLLSPGLVTVDAAAALSAPITLLVVHSGSVKLLGSVTLTAPDSSVRLVTRGNVEVDTGGLLSAATVVVRCARLTVAGTVSATRSADATCGAPLAVPPDCSTQPAGMALWLSASTLSAAGTVRAPTAYLCATNVTISGSVTANGNGCPAQQGPGAGATAGSLPGSGGGHGGAGGSGVAQDGSRSTGGATYDHGALPAYMGSGGGSATNGGMGGGFVAVRATVGLQLKGRVSADGAAGTSSASAGVGGGGGGAGGSVLFFTPRITGLRTAIITANGGAGGTPGGGGGGGGIVAIVWGSVAGAGDSHAQLLVQGGAGAASAVAGLPGGAGFSHSTPSCQAGFGTALCIECLPGSFSPLPGSEPCRPCRNGTYAPAPRATKCQGCPVGSAATTGASNCTVCAAGYVVALNASTCLPCPQGSTSSADHLNCTVCPGDAVAAHRGSPRCSACGVGQRADATRTQCENCPLPPAHADAAAGVDAAGNCLFTCRTGYRESGAECLSSWTWLLRHGGVLVIFAVLAAVMLLSVTLVWMCWRLRRASTDEGVQLEEEDEAALFGEDLSLAYKPLSEWGPAASRQRRRKSISIFQHLPDPSTSAVLRSITLTQEDMPNHVARIYFEGGNTFNMPLACPRAAPPAAASLVLPREFEDLAKNCDTADMWTTAQWRTCALLRAFCFPLAILYEQRLRRVTVAAVRQALVGNDHACMRSARARALARSLKFATSACGTLAWLDVLCCDDDDRAALNAGMPRLPLVLMCAGTGDFFDPFQLPSRDALAVFVGHSMFGSGWLMFAAHLNALLRQVRREPLDASDWLAMARLVDYVDILNLAGIGIGGAMPLSGITVDVAVVPATNDPLLALLRAVRPTPDTEQTAEPGASPSTASMAGNGSNSTMPLAWEDDLSASMTSTRAVTGRGSQRRLAVVLRPGTVLPRAASCASIASADTEAPVRVDGEELFVPLPNNALLLRDLLRLQQRPTPDGAPAAAASVTAASSRYSRFAGRSGSASSLSLAANAAPLAPSLSAHSTPVGAPARAGGGVALEALASAPAPPTAHRWRHGIYVRAARAVFGLLPWLVLRHVRPRGQPAVVKVLLSVLLAIDFMWQLALCFMLHVAGSALYVPVLAVYPLANFLAPLFGLMAVVVDSMSATRFLAALNMLSMLNAAVFVMVCLSCLLRGIDPAMLFVALPVLNVLLKAGLAYLICLHVAHLSLHSDRRWMQRMLTQFTAPSGAAATSRAPSSRAAIISPASRMRVLELP